MRVSNESLALIKLYIKYQFLKKNGYHTLYANNLELASLEPD